MSSVLPFKKGDTEATLRANGLAGQGGPPDNGDMEARVAKLEAAVEHIQRDIADVKTDLRAFKTDAKSDFKDARDLEWRNFLRLASLIIAVALGLAGLMAKGFKWF